MDNSSSLVPGRNPTGGPSYGSEGYVPGLGSTSGTNPLLPQPNLPAGAPMANPYDTSVVPNFGANGGAYKSTNLAAGAAAPGATNGSTAANSPIGGMNLMSSKDISRLFGTLKNLYGDGIAHQMLDFLTTGAGFNQGAINNLFAALQPGINRGEQDLMNQFSTSGNRFGSGAQIGLADYLSQVNLNEGQLETQMYEQSISNYMNMLEGVSSQSLQKKETSGSIWDTIGGALIDAASIAGAPFTGGASLIGLSAGSALMSKGKGGGSSVPSFAPAQLSMMPGDNAGQPTGNLPTSINSSNLSILDMISSLTGGGSLDNMASVLPPSFAF